MYVDPQQLKGGIMSGGRNKILDQLTVSFNEYGYSADFCKEFNKALIEDKKGIKSVDVLFLASLYNKSGDSISAEFYLDKAQDMKMNNDERFMYCCEMLFLLSKRNKGKDGDIFRANNIKFMQTYLQKNNESENYVNLYTVLALVDCANRRYADAFSLLQFGYKPAGRNDKLFLRILTTAVYIYAKMGNKEGLSEAAENAKRYLKTFSSFSYKWEQQYLEECILKAEKGKL